MTREVPILPCADVRLTAPAVNVPPDGSVMLPMVLMVRLVGKDEMLDKISRSPPLLLVPTTKVPAEI